MNNNNCSNRYLPLTLLIYFVFKQAGQTDDEMAEKTGKKKDFDDRYYDLDDNFIDDGDLEDGYNNGLGGMMPDEHYNNFEDENESGVQNSSINVEFDPEADERKEEAREERQYKQIV